MKKQINWLFGLILLTLMASCTGKSSKDNGETDSIQLFRLGAMPSVDYLPFALAEKLGYYDSLGVDLQIVKFFSPNERDAALQAGELEATITDYTSAMIQQGAGLPVRLWSACDGSFSLISTTAQTDSIWSSLSGKKFALSSNTVIDYATEVFLGHHGVAPTSIQKVEVQKVPLRLEMLANKEIDAAVLPEPLATIALGKGLFALSNTQKEEINITGVALWGKELKPEVLALLQQGYDKAVSYMQTHPKTEWIEVLATELNIPVELANKINLPNYQPLHKPEAWELNSVADWLKARGLIKAEYTTDSLVVL